MDKHIKVVMLDGICYEFPGDDNWCDKLNQVGGHPWLMFETETGDRVVLRAENICSITYE